jgi:hypothetical protein
MKFDTKYNIGDKVEFSVNVGKYTICECCEQEVYSPMFKTVLGKIEAIEVSKDNVYYIIKYNTTRYKIEEAAIK